MLIVRLSSLHGAFANSFAATLVPVRRANNSTASIRSSAPHDLSRDLLDHGKWDPRRSERTAAPFSTRWLLRSLVLTLPIRHSTTDTTVRSRRRFKCTRRKAESYGPAEAGQLATWPCLWPGPLLGGIDVRHAPRIAG